MPRIRRVTCQTRAESAPRPPATSVSNHYLSRPRVFNLQWQHRGLHPSSPFLTFKLAHCPTPATQTATSWLIQLMTELFNCVTTSITLRKAITPCFPQCNYARKHLKEKLCPRRDRPQQASQTTTFRDPVYSDLLWKHRGLHPSWLSNLHIVPRLPHKLPPLDWAT